MQWTDDPNGLFPPEGVETRLPVNPNYQYGTNAEEQGRNPNSLLNYYKHLLRVRRNTPALIVENTSLYITLRKITLLFCA